MTIWVAFGAKKPLLHALLACKKAKNRFFCWIREQYWGGQLVVSWPLQELANSLKCSPEYVERFPHVIWLFPLGYSNTLASQTSKKSTHTIDPFRGEKYSKKFFRGISAMKSSKNWFVSTLIWYLTICNTEFWIFKFSNFSDFFFAKISGWGPIEVKND